MGLLLLLTMPCCLCPVFCSLLPAGCCPTDKPTPTPQPDEARENVVVSAFLAVQTAAPQGKTPGLYSLTKANSGALPPPVWPLTYFSHLCPVFSNSMAHSKRTDAARLQWQVLSCGCVVDSLQWQCRSAGKKGLATPPMHVSISPIDPVQQNQYTIIKRNETTFMGDLALLSFSIRSQGGSP